jgi:hypothetical protein
VTLEFCPFLLPEFVFTGHEIARGGEVEIPDRYKEYFQIIMDNPDIFPGFFHVDLANNVFPKLQLLRKFGFYPEAQPIPVKMAQPDGASQGAAAPAVPEPPPAFKPDGTPNPQRIEPQELATRAGRE